MERNLEQLQQLAQTIRKKIGYLQEELIKLSDPNQKFSVEMEIADLEGQLAKVSREIEEAYGLDVFSESSVLEQRIRQLNITEELGEIHLVNCDRKPVADSFWDAFDGYYDRKNPFQFYFVLADPAQQPNSFSERMIYEVLIEELEEELGAINYVRQPGSRRVKIEDLPLGRNFRNSRKGFKKYFSQRFHLGEAKTSFEDYLKTGIPQMEYEYVATVFDLNASKWDQDLMEEYLQWIMDAFQNPHPDVPNFLFFFAIFLRHAHAPDLPSREKKVLEGMYRIIDQNKARCTLLTQLTPVPVELLEDWIRDLGVQNQSLIDDLVRTIVAGLPKDKKDRFQLDGSLDMADIERFQEILYRTVNA